MTIAHVAIIDAAHAQCRLDGLDLAISRVALVKEDGHRHTLEERVAALEALGATRPWLAVVVTDAQLVADIAEGYDVVVLGADKWVQLHDVTFYGGSAAARDAALARLPAVAVAPRPPAPVPLDDAVVLDIPAHLSAVSSTAVWDGRREWDGRR